MAEEDQRWLRQGTAAWGFALHNYLKRPAELLPPIIVFDSGCTYTLGAGSDAGLRWSVTAHRGEIVLPNGARIPPAPTAFNAVTDTGHNFVVMSLPSVWRPVAPKSEIPLEQFLEGVMLHELSHSYQATVTPQVSFPALLKRLAPLQNVSDDSVQEAFEANPAYVRDYQAETDLLFRAASVPRREEARAHACDALGLLRARRAKYFAGSNAHWALVDELSLTTEGLGQWVSYSWLSSGRRIRRDLVLQKLRGPYWSQEEGLALFLTIDRLVPRWQALMFSSSPSTAEGLLQRACGR